MSEEEITEPIEDDLIELVDEAGETHRYYHLDTIEYKGEHYVCFEPADEADGEEGEVVIFRLGDPEGDELFPIEDDSVLEEVFAEFMERLDEADAAEDAMRLEGED